KIIRMYIMARNEKSVLPFLDSKATLRSLLHWLVPFASRNWRERWVITTATFLFHMGVIILPIFVLAHNALIYESWGISWWTVSEGFADFMTIIVMLCCIFFSL